MSIIIRCEGPRCQKEVVEPICDECVTRMLMEEREAGFKDGKEAGHEEGYDEGYEKGSEVGFKDGYERDKK